MKIRLDANVEFWLKNIELEADSEEEAIRILKGMTLEDLLAADEVNIRDISSSDIDTEIAFYDATVKLTNLSVDPAWYEYDTEEERLALIDKIPSELTLELVDLEDTDISLDIDEALELKFDIAGTYSYDYKIISKN